MKISTHLFLLGCFAAFTASASEADPRNATNASCRQETKRVAVWTPGPKPATAARFEQREVQVCDGKVSQQLAKGK